MRDLPSCPQCESAKHVVKHCEGSPTCDMAICRHCKTIYVPGHEWKWRKHPDASPDGPMKGIAP